MARSKATESGTKLEPWLGVDLPQHVHRFASAGARADEESDKRPLGDWARDQTRVTLGKPGLGGFVVHMIAYGQRYHYVAIYE